MKATDQRQAKPERRDAALTDADLLVLAPWLFFGAGLAAIGYGLLGRRRVSRRPAVSRRASRRPAVSRRASRRRAVSRRAPGRRAHRHRGSMR